MIRTFPTEGNPTNPTDATPVLEAQSQEESKSSNGNRTNPNPGPPPPLPLPEDGLVLV